MVVAVVVEAVAFLVFLMELAVVLEAAQVLKVLEPQTQAAQGQSVKVTLAEMPHLAHLGMAVLVVEQALLEQLMVRVALGQLLQSQVLR